MPETDKTTGLLKLAARLHSARGDPGAWRAAIAACRDWFDCRDVLDLPQDAQPLGPDELEALAGRLTHCANFGIGGCAKQPEDEPKRRQCAALAPHLHQAAMASRNAIQASLFDLLPPTWILGPEGRVREANARARALTASGERFAIADGCLVGAIPGSMPQLRKLLPALAAEARLSWHDALGEATLLLRPLEGGAGVAATLLPEPPRSEELASLLAERFKLPRRQSELAAHLVAGHSLVDSAKLMGITRHTANEHLAALLRRTGTGERKAMIALFRRAVHR